jgi:hypothetical protein
MSIVCQITGQSTIVEHICLIISQRVVREPGRGAILAPQAHAQGAFARPG